MGTFASALAQVRQQKPDAGAPAGDFASGLAAVRGQQAQPAAAAPAPPQPTLTERIGNAYDSLKRGANDLVGGAATSLAEAPQKLAALPGFKQINAHDPTAGIVGPLYNRMLSAVAPPNPNSAAAKVGRIGEQTAEMMGAGPEKLGVDALKEGLPRAIGRIGANAGIAGGDAALHGQPAAPAALIGGGASAIGEVASPVSKALKKWALNQYLKAVYPTGAASKFTADRIGPEMLDRGIVFRNASSLARQGTIGTEKAGERLGSATERMIGEANAPNFQRLALPPRTMEVGIPGSEPSLAPMAFEPQRGIARAASGQMQRTYGSDIAAATPGSPAKPAIPEVREQAPPLHPSDWFNVPRDQRLATAIRDEPTSGPGIVFRREGPAAGPIVERPMTQTQPLVDKLEQFKSSFRTPNTKVPASPNHQSAIDYIGGLQNVLRSHGEHISYRDLNGLRQMYDEAVAARGGYSGADILSTMHAAAEKQAANIYRDALAAPHPDLAALKKEYSFWSRVRDLGEASRKRQVGQQGGMTRTVTDPLLALAGFGAGGGAGGAAAAVALNEAVRSPLWRTVSAVTKNRIANALAAGDKAELTAALGKLTAAIAGNH